LTFRATSARLAAERGVALLAAPVSGNPKAARAGQLSVAVSGPRDAYERALPYLQMFGRSVSYVGEGEAARLVKICHNLILGVVAQILAETTILAERGGIARADYLGFINESVMGSTFTRYKTPAYVNLDYTPTFTGHLLRKDFELGLAAAREHNVPVPLTALTHQIVVSLIGQGFGEQDFASLLEVAARGANLTLEPDTRFVPDGLDTPERLQDRGLKASRERRCRLPAFWDGACGARRASSSSSPTARRNACVRKDFDVDWNPGSTRQVGRRRRKRQAVRHRPRGQCRRVLSRGSSRGARLDVDALDVRGGGGGERRVRRPEPGANHRLQLGSSSWSGANTKSSTIPRTPEGHTQVSTPKEMPGKSTGDIRRRDTAQSIIELCRTGLDPEALREHLLPRLRRRRSC